MNIFVTDISPACSAINLDDKRVRHMPKESLELLAIYLNQATNIWHIRFPFWNEKTRDAERLIIHPVAKWIQKDKRHMSWLWRHHNSLLAENLFRFGEVDSDIKYSTLELGYHLNKYLTTDDPTWFQNSSLFKSRKDVIEAYRDTMVTKWTVTDKIKPVIWTNRSAPYWFQIQQKLEL